MSDKRNELTEYRKAIDLVDGQIIELLENRLDIVRNIARYKERKALPVLDAAREQDKIRALEDACDPGKAPYVTGVLKEIMVQSRAYQQDNRLLYGLLGERLGHSYSPQIHKIIGGYEYGLYERQPDQLDEFFAEGTFRGISVTMPYKKDVIKYCADISDRARKCSSVNTIIRREDGSYYGDNTDYYGFMETVISSGAEVKGKKALIFGNGGVSGTVRQVLTDMGADPVVVISRRGENNYDNLSMHYDASILVNTTPVGMYPNAGEAVVDVRKFEECKAVFDLIYNPLRTKFMLDAEEAGIPAFGGLHMLAAQAAMACRLFLCEETDMRQKTRIAEGQMRRDIENIVLIGMPGSGKTTTGKRLARIMGRQFVDCDEKIREVFGKSAGEIIKSEGAGSFRSKETEIIKQVMRRGPLPDGSTPGIVFATGGGCVEREENRVPLLENSLVVYITRDISELSLRGRPISQEEGPEAIYRRRKDRYEQWSDFHIELNSNAAEDILEKISEREII